MKKLIAFLISISMTFPISGAMIFNGSSSYVTANLATNVTTNFTMSAWVKVGSLNQNSVMFVNNGWDNRITNGFGYGMGIGNGAGGSGGKLTGVLSGIVWIDSGYSFPDTTSWHHVIMTRDTTTTSFYVDGVPQSGSSALVPQTPATVTSLAAQYDNVSAYGGFFLGELEDVRIYNRTLTQAEITSLFESRSRLAMTDGLVAYWMLDEGNEGQTASGAGNVLDRSGSNNNGTANNSPVYTQSSLNYP